MPLGHQRLLLHAREWWRTAMAVFAFALLPILVGAQGTTGTRYQGFAGWSAVGTANISADGYSTTLTAPPFPVEQAGAVWAPVAVWANTSFSVSFTMSVSDGNGYALWYPYQGAYGWTFVVHADPRGATALGGTGARRGVHSIGYWESAVGPGVALLVNDAYMHSAAWVTLPNWDDNGGTTLGYITAPVNVTIRYDAAAGMISAATDPTTVTMAVDLATVLGSSTAVIGFTAGTEMVGWRHIVSNVTISSNTTSVLGPVPSATASTTPSATATPTPSTIPCGDVRQGPSVWAGFNNWNVSGLATLKSGCVAQIPLDRGTVDGSLTFTSPTRMCGHLTSPARVPTNSSWQLTFSLGLQHPSLTWFTNVESLILAMCPYVEGSRNVLPDMCGVSYSTKMNLPALTGCVGMVVRPEYDTILGGLSQFPQLSPMPLTSSYCNRMEVNMTYSAALGALYLVTTGCDQTANSSIGVDLATSFNTPTAMWGFSGQPFGQVTQSYFGSELQWWPFTLSNMRMQLLPWQTGQPDGAIAPSSSPSPRPSFSSSSSGVCGWSAVGSAIIQPSSCNATLTSSPSLVTTTNEQAGALWAPFDLPIRESFTVLFTMVADNVPSGQGGGEGWSFVLHNDWRGRAAIGGGGYRRGVLAIPGSIKELPVTPAVGLTVFDYTNDYLKGALGPLTSDANGNLPSQFIMSRLLDRTSVYTSVNFTYDANAAVVWLYSACNGWGFQRSVPLNISRALGNASSAITGFTAGTGGALWRHTVSDVIVLGVGGAVSPSPSPLPSGPTTLSNDTWTLGPMVRVTRQFTQTGPLNLTVPAGVTSVAVLVVAGGGGGGGTTDRSGGGGGAGGVTCANISVTGGQVLTGIVGRGGLGGDSACYRGSCARTGGNGNSSALGSLVAIGGGGGGGGYPCANPTSGGSGGGRYHYSGCGVSGSGVAGQGYAGGAFGYDDGSSSFTAAGGGGAGSIGGSGMASAGGAGGPGVQCLLVGVSSYFGGGGGGGAEYKPGGAGGIGGGGAGASNSGPTLSIGESGLPNTGGGGGGSACDGDGTGCGGYGSRGGDGGSGIVIVSWWEPASNCSSCASPSPSSVGASPSPMPVTTANVTTPTPSRTTPPKACVPRPIIQAQGQYPELAGWKAVGSAVLGVPCEATLTSGPTGANNYADQTGALWFPFNISLRNVFTLLFTMDVKPSGWGSGTGWSVVVHADTRGRAAIVGGCQGYGVVNTSNSNSVGSSITPAVGLVVHEFNYFVGSLGPVPETALPVPDFHMSQALVSSLQVNLTYDADKTTLYVSSTGVDLSVSKIMTLDIATALGGVDTGVIGFTAGTGSAWSHTVSNVTLWCTPDFMRPPSPSPSPAAKAAGASVSPSTSVSATSSASRSTTATATRTPSDTPRVSAATTVQGSAQGSAWATPSYTGGAVLSPTATNGASTTPSITASVSATPSRVPTSCDDPTYQSGSIDAGLAAQCTAVTSILVDVTLPMFDPALLQQDNATAETNARQSYCAPVPLPVGELSCHLLDAIGSAIGSNWLNTPGFDATGVISYSVVPRAGRRLQTGTAPASQAQLYGAIATVRVGLTGPFDAGITKVAWDTNQPAVYNVAARLAVLFDAPAHGWSPSEVLNARTSIRWTLYLASGLDATAANAILYDESSMESMHVAPSPRNNNTVLANVFARAATAALDKFKLPVYHRPWYDTVEFIASFFTILIVCCCGAVVVCARRGCKCGQPRKEYKDVIDDFRSRLVVERMTRANQGGGSGQLHEDGPDVTTAGHASRTAVMVDLPSPSNITMAAGTVQPLLDGVASLDQPHSPIQSLEAHLEDTPYETPARAAREQAKMRVALVPVARTGSFKNLFAGISLQASPQARHGSSSNGQTRSEAKGQDRKSLLPLPAGLGALVSTGGLQGLWTAGSATGTGTGAPTAASSAVRSGQDGAGVFAVANPMRALQAARPAGEKRTARTASGQEGQDGHLLGHVPPVLPVGSGVPNEAQADGSAAGAGPTTEVRLTTTQLHAVAVPITQPPALPLPLPLPRTKTFALPSGTKASAVRAQQPQQDEADAMSQSDPGAVDELVDAAAPGPATAT